MGSYDEYSQGLGGWEYVGKFMRFRDDLVEQSRVVLRRAFGVEEGGEIPPVRLSFLSPVRADYRKDFEGTRRAGGLAGEDTLGSIEEATRHDRLQTDRVLVFFSSFLSSSSPSTSDTETSKPSARINLLAPAGPSLSSLTLSRRCRTNSLWEVVASPNTFWS